MPRGVLVLQATEAELKSQVDRLTDQCARLDASLHEANNETEKLRVKLFENQPMKFASDADQPLLQDLQQRITANKACFPL